MGVNACQVKNNNLCFSKYDKIIRSTWLLCRIGSYKKSCVCSIVNFSQDRKKMQLLTWQESELNLYVLTWKRPMIYLMKKILQNNMYYTSQLKKIKLYRCTIAKYIEGDTY
jgi:hypothetical protein